MTLSEALRDDIVALKTGAFALLPSVAGAGSKVQRSPAAE